MPETEPAPEEVVEGEGEDVQAEEVQCFIITDAVPVRSLNLALSLLKKVIADVNSAPWCIFALRFAQDVLATLQETHGLNLPVASQELTEKQHEFMGSYPEFASNFWESETQGNAESALQPGSPVAAVLEVMRA